MTYYKLFDANTGLTLHGRAAWSLGEWQPKLVGKIEPCSRGYHVLRVADLTSWLDRDAIAVYVVETKYKVVEADNKVVARQARTTRFVGTTDAKLLRLFAADCAEHVLPIFEKYQVGDDRPRKAIEAARQYARGEISAAARAAAWDAAGDAAWAAARDAARAAARDAARAAAGDAAGAAAGAAARDAARAAAWDAGWAAERQWQGEHLLEMLA